MKVMLMEMGYGVKSPNPFRKAKPGDSVKYSIGTSMNGAVRRMGAAENRSRDMDERIDPTAFLVLATFVFALAWAAPPAGAQPFGGSSPGLERPDTRQKTTLEEALEGHKAVARSCETPRGFRRISIK